MIFNRKLIIIFCVFSICLLSGCYSYIVPSNVPTSTISAIGSMKEKQLFICINDKEYLYRVGTEDKYDVKVPANKKLFLRVSEIVGVKGRFTAAVCSGKLSFTPVENQSYILDLNLIGTLCALDLVKVNPDRINRIEIEKSVKYGDYVCRNPF